MSILVIEGDPGTIEHLVEELLRHNYINEDEFNFGIVEASDFKNSDNWNEFFCDFEHFLEYFI